MMNQTLDKKPTNLPVPAGQERLATQEERDDVNRMIEDSDSSSVKTSDQP